MIINADAEIIQITATGAIDSTEGFDSTVQVGGTFTQTFTFDTQVLPSASNGALQAVYQEPTGIAVETFGDYSISQTGFRIQINCNYYGGYDYDLLALNANGIGDTDFSISLDSAELPTTSLSIYSNLSLLLMASAVTIRLPEKMY